MSNFYISSAGGKAKAAGEDQAETITASGAHPAGGNECSACTFPPSGICYNYKESVICVVV